MTEQVITNNQYRPLLDWYDLTVKEREQFTYLTNEVSQESALFFRYKGTVYCLDEFIRTTEELNPWEQYRSETFFSGILLKWRNYADYEVIVGRYSC